jgi:malonyl-CoA/methylmalonyl-CoA synthetase
MKKSGFIDLLNRQFQDNRHRPALIYRQDTLTFGQLAAKGENAAAFLQAEGLRRGDVVVLYTPEKLPFLVVHLGIILAGGISLPLNFNFTPEELVYFLNDSGARFVFASGRQAESIRTIKPQCPRLEQVFDPGRTAAAPASRKFKEIDLAAGAPCFMLYSSGTTGQPKGVVHTHGNVAAALLSLQHGWQFRPEDVLLNVLPLFHIHGLSFAAHLSLVSGSTMILKDKFHPRQTMENIHRATVFMGVPTFYYSFLDRRELAETAKKWRRTRLFTCGSAPIRPEILAEIEAIMGKHLINRYGMTESHVITSLPLAGPFKQGSVGLPLEGVDIKVEGGGSEAGEVKIRGETLFSCYWNKPEATGKAFDGEGFFGTGDLGYLDKDGFLTLVGRKDDLIITGGYNVYPPVVERVINGFLGVKESAVFGIPDLKKGEQVAAAVVAGGSLDIDELRRYCRQRLVNYQCPLRFERLDSLPRNTMGKVLKRELKARFTV